MTIMCSSFNPILALVFLLLLSCSAIDGVSAEILQAPKAQSIGKWERMPLSTSITLRECEVMCLEIESLRIDANASGPLPVILVRLPNTNAIWGCVQQRQFGPPKMLLVNGHPWGVESDVDTKGIRIMRLRKIATRQPVDRESLLALVVKEYGSYRMSDHLFTPLPLASVLPQKLQKNPGAAGFAINAVEFNSFDIRTEVIFVSGSMDNKQMALTFDLSWNLKEFRLAGEVIEFDRDKWSRAYAVWKKALEKEIMETKK